MNQEQLAISDALYEKVVAFLTENRNDTTVGTAVRYLQLFPAEFEVAQVGTLTQIATIGLAAGITSIAD